MTARDFVAKRRPVKNALQKRRGTLSSRALDSLGRARRGGGVSRTATAGLVFGSLGTGALLTYLFGSNGGRRAGGRGSSRSARRAGDFGGVTAGSLRNRARGLLAGLRSLFSPADAADDVIEDRVRSRLGRVASYPDALHVESDRGDVTIGGPVLADELDDVLGAVWDTRGVQSVRNRLEPHELTDVPNIPAFEGGMFEQPPRDSWPPATRLLAAAAGVGGMAYCAGRRTLPAALCGTAGFFLFVRAVADRPLSRLFAGIRGRDAGGFDVRRSIDVDAPIEDVYAFWSDYDNFPLFMNQVEDVCDCGDGTSHWTVEGPAGSAVEWDAFVTDDHPNRRIAWQSAPDAAVDNAGCVEFSQNDDGTTRVDVILSYAPPAGVNDDELADLLGAGAEDQLAGDLRQMKRMVERGTPRRGGGAAPAAQPPDTAAR
jgi:uncharacterized membrane protein